MSTNQSNEQMARQERLDAMRLAFVLVYAASHDQVIARPGELTPAFSAAVATAFGPDLHEDLALLTLSRARDRSDPDPKAREQPGTWRSLVLARGRMRERFLQQLTYDVDHEQGRDAVVQTIEGMGRLVRSETLAIRALREIRRADSKQRFIVRLARRAIGPVRTSQKAA